ncbi:MAG: DUF4479 domain-containing protein [Bacilli bacterium]
MKYGMYYNYKTVGDVLMISYLPNEIPNKVISSNNVTSLYKDNDLVGINIFDISKVMKIKATGLITNLNINVLNVINSILKNNNVKELEEQKESGFKVGKILTLEEHPDSEHLHILTVDINSDKPLDIVCGAYNAKVGLKVVVATLYTFMPNGQQILPSKLLGVDSNGMLCSGRELNLEGYEGKRGLLELDDSYNIGDDFFKQF